MRFGYLLLSLACAVSPMQRYTNDLTLAMLSTSENETLALINASWYQEGDCLEASTFCIDKIDIKNNLVILRDGRVKRILHLWS